jgi:hypothetical protein
MSLCPLLRSECGVPQISLYAHGSGFVPVIVALTDVVKGKGKDPLVGPFQHYSLLAYCTLDS